MNESGTAAIEDLIEEIVSAFRQLRVVSAAVHGDGAPMPGQRGVLVDLERLGPKTVAGMARARGVSRQHIQALVDGFRSRGLVAMADNPAHRRSKLVALTSGGRALVKAMLKRERAALGALDLRVAPAQVRSAAATLRAFRQQLQAYPGGRRR